MQPHQAIHREKHNIKADIRGCLAHKDYAGEAGLHAALVQRFGADQVERRRLDVGDVVLTGDSGAVVLIERKTWADLAKSLTDGRYAEQKARLLSCVAAGCGARADGGAVGTATCC